jgi:CheY-like chemotaxis protein
MRKKILIAEKSDAIRSIAESILHQNGFDVITAGSAEKAKELIITCEPNMVIVGADLKDIDEKYLYDMLEENETTASIPILIIADPEGRSLAYPDEVILPRPFDPRDFLERVRLFVGSGMDSKDSSGIDITAEPFSETSIDDEFLDSALGLDSIEVEESEEVDKTWANARHRPRANAGGGDAYDIRQPDPEEKNGKGDSKKVESLMIRDDSAEGRKPDESAQAKLSGTSKIEIASDQYGLISRDKGKDNDTMEQAPAAEKHHDYEWFINEMQKEAGPVPKKSGSTVPVSPKIETTPTSDMLEPAIRPGETPADNQDTAASAPVPRISPDGMDSFIADFKKEAEEIKAKPTWEIEAEMRPHEPAADAEPEDDIRHFVTDLVDLLSEKLAKKIVEKIDKDEIYEILKSDLEQLIAGKK